jgi:hypothetical protein
MRNPLDYLNNIILYALFAIIATASQCGPQTSSNKQEAVYIGQVNSSLVNYNLIEKDGKINKHLLEFLELFGIKHQGTVQSVNEAMQQYFIRKPGLERWDLVDTPEEQEKREVALSLLSKMGFVNEIPHSQTTAKYYLLFGATLPRMEQRFQDFVQQYNQGTLQCSHIVLLGGVRKLKEDEIASISSGLGDRYADFVKTLNKQPKELTEADALRFIWEVHASNSLKAKFQEGKNLSFVNSTDITQSTNLRPTTGSTIEAWFTDFNPEPGICHSNVEKPYGIRMEKNLRLLLEKRSQALPNTSSHYSITWNSPAAKKGLLLSTYKDELARSFYQEYTLKKYLGMLQE